MSTFLLKLRAWMLMGANVILPPILLYSIIYTILEDDFLSKHISLVMPACVCFLTVSYLWILSSVAELRPRLYKQEKSLSLRDSDFTFDHEIKISHLEGKEILQFFQKSLEFCNFRPVYGLMLVVGAGLLGTHCIIRIIDKNSQKDLYLASVALFVPGIILTGTVLFLANSGVYVSDSKHLSRSYKPFQETIEIPMKIIAGRTLSAFTIQGWMNFFQSIFITAYTSISVYSLYYVYHRMTEETFGKLQMRSYVVNVRMFLIVSLGFSTSAGLIVLAQQLFISPYVKAKRCLLVIIEKNWRQNIPAMEFLLPDIEVESLEELQAALNSKRAQRLTEEEKRALKYIDLPLWQTKLPFIGCRRQIKLTDQPASVQDVACLRRSIPKPYASIPIKVGGDLKK